MTFTFDLPTFLNISSNRFSIISLSHLNIISSFIIYSFFNTCIPILPFPLLSLLIFLFCFILLLMNNSTSGLENGCSLAKNFLSFKEAVGARFSSFFFWFHSLYFGFTYSIGDALILSLSSSTFKTH